MDSLEALAIRRFGNLSEAEKRLLRAAPKGNFAMCGPNWDSKNPANDPSKAPDWGSEREIRAELVRWLCVDHEASTKINPPGIAIYAAKVTGKLDLLYASVAFPLRLTRCSLADSGDLRYVKIPALYLDGSSIGWLNLDGADVKNSVFLNEGFSSAAGVRLVGTQIGGDLECSGGAFNNSNGDALNVNRAEVRGAIFLNGNFSAVGTVRLSGAVVGGNLECSGGTFKNRGEWALLLENIRVEGNVVLGEGFSADEGASLNGAQIGEYLVCTGGRFKALNLEAAVVKGAFFWTRLQGAGSTWLNLTDASVGTISDDESSWPNRGNLFLEGFVYGHISSGPTDAQARLGWLDRQKDFKPQPYRQLAKVLRERGDDDGAKQVVFELEKRSRAEDRRRIVCAPIRWFRFGEDAVLDATVGYGIYPKRAIWWLCGLTMLGWIVHRRAQVVGAMAPTDKDAYTGFRNGQTPAHYQPFSPMIYSFENCIPLVKLGQDERWQPDPNPQCRARLVTGGRFKRVVNSAFDWLVTPKILRRIRWFMIIFGWLLATFFVAGLTGILKTN